MNSNLLNLKNIDIAKKDKSEFEKVYNDNLEHRLNIKNDMLLKNNTSRRRKVFLTKNDSGHRNRLARDKLRLKLMERNNL